MIIYFLRHGDAVEGADLQDPERPLSDLGQRQASAVGRFLHSTNALIDYVLCSPLVRAKQTAETLMQDLGPLPMRSTDTLISSSNPGDILLELQKLKKERVLLVGHEPHLSKTISLLLSGDSRTRIEMRKGSLACVSMPSAIGAERGVLRWLVSSEQLMKKD